MILALIIDICIIILTILIAGNYYRFWHRYCQETEPFTRHFSRMAEAFPWFWWPLNGGLAILSALTAIFAPWYWAVIGIIGTAFMGWFIPHIWDYVVEHGADNPPYKTRGMPWRRP